MSVVPGGIFLEDVAPNRSLPGIRSSEGRWYAPYDVMRDLHRRPYASDEDGWTTVRHRRRIYRKNARWAGSAPVVVAEATVTA
jgi:hypothetical protein